VRAHIWDTAGQERFRAITSTYYSGADGAIIAFDLSRKSEQYLVRLFYPVSADTFKGVIKWLEDLRMHTDRKRFSVLLVGNKNDLYSKREVTMEDINRFCTQNKLAYIETSALTPVNVDAAFEKLCQQIKAKHKRVKKPKEIVSRRLTPSPLICAL